MGESLPTGLTLEGFLSCVNPLVLLQMVFELEGLATVTTFKFPKVRAVLVVGHVAHQLLQVGELLAAESAGLVKQLPDLYYFNARGKGGAPTQHAM